MTQHSSYTSYLYSTLRWPMYYGLADIFTTVEDIPYARGTLTVTSSDWSSATRTVSKVVSTWSQFTKPSPDCFIHESDCTSMWRSYASNLGLNQTTSFPIITPQPVNEPSCVSLSSDGPLTLESGAPISLGLGPEVAPCAMYGKKVQVCRYTKCIVDTALTSTASCSTGMTLGTAVLSGSETGLCHVRRLTQSSPACSPSPHRPSTSGSTPYRQSPRQTLYRLTLLAPYILMFCWVCVSFDNLELGSTPVQLYRLHTSFKSSFLVSLTVSSVAFT